MSNLISFPPSGPGWKLIDTSKCTWMSESHAKALLWIISGIVAPAHPLMVGNLNTADRKTCPGHPEGFHASGFDVDLSYFTKDGANDSQLHGPDYLFTNDESDPAKIDIAKCILLWRLIRVVFPQSVVQVDYRIARLAYRSGGEDIRGWLAEDYDTKYLHWNHMHVGLDSLVAFVPDFKLPLVQTTKPLEVKACVNALIYHPGPVVIWPCSNRDGKHNDFPAYSEGACMVDTRGDAFNAISETGFEGGDKPLSQEIMDKVKSL